MSFCQFEGAPCFQHPNYLFYKAFKYKANNRNRILTSGDFFFLKILKEVPVCIGEIELLWKDVASNQFLASLKLYFRPEHTPGGRQDDAGEDEVIALGERLIVKLDDLIPLIRHDIKWKYGSPTYCGRGDRFSERKGDLADGCERGTRHDGGKCGNMTGCDDVKNGDVLKGENGKKWNIGLDKARIANVDPVCDKACSGAANLVVLNYQKYCRYRAMHKRLEGCENEWIHLAVVVAIGGFSGRAPGCRVMFCRDTFYQAEYDDLDIKMDHMLPILKGRPKGKKSKQLAQKDSQQDSDSMEEIHANITPSISTSSRPRRSTESSSEITEDKVSTEEQAFLIGLHKFMHDAKMPIGRIPSLGFKQIDLYYFYKQAEKLGGYDAITHKRMWKHLYDKLGGNSSNTSAATCTRKHYERLLLPYERHLRKLKVGKAKKKHRKRQQNEPDTKRVVEDVSKRTVVKEDVEVKPKVEVKEEVIEPDNKENARLAFTEDSQNIQKEAIILKDKVVPTTTEHSKQNLQEESEVMEIPIVLDKGAAPEVDVKTLESKNNFQHFSFAQIEQLHQQEALKPATGLTTLSPSGVLMLGENPALPYANMVYRGGYLVPARPHHMLHTPWALMAPVVPPSSPSTSSIQTSTDGSSPHLGTIVKDSILAPLPPMPSSSKINQNTVPFAVSSQDIRSKSSSGKLSLSSQTFRLPSPSGSRALKATHVNTSYKPTPIHLKDDIQPAHANTPYKPPPIHLKDDIQPAHQSSQSSQHFSSNDFLGSSSHSLASLLHPAPPGHRNQPHLPPAPATIYLHPSSTNQFPLLQSPVTFPPPIAHCYPRKRAYPFDSSTVPSTGAFPSPDMVLDRIRNSTGLPRSSVALANPPKIRQQFEDPRNIFRQTPQPVSTSQNTCPSQNKEPLLQLEKQSSTKSKNSGRKCQRGYSAYGHMSSQELQHALLRQDIVMPSNNNKVMDQIKPTSNLNGLLSAQHSSKLVTSVPLPRSIPLSSPLPSSSKDGRLTSALFGTQFTALPRSAKPSELPSPQSHFVDSSSAASVAMSLNSHLHPAFMNPFLQPGASAAASSLNPQLQMLASSYATPAQLTAYEEMLRQNGYSTFLTTSAAQRKGTNKN